MKTANQIVCVLRSIEGLPQWVAASDRHDLVPGENAMVGIFDRFEVRTGPSGSHVQACYEPHRGAMEGALDIDESERIATASGETGFFRTCIVRSLGALNEFCEALGGTDWVSVT